MACLFLICELSCTPWSNANWHVLFYINKPFEIGSQTMGLQICIECNSARAVCMAFKIWLLNIEPLHLWASHLWYVYEGMAES